MLAAWILIALVYPAIAQAQSTGPDSEEKSLWERQHLTGDWRGSRTRLENAGVTFELEQKSEAWGNSFGGIRTGVIYDGLTTASFELDLNKLMDWRGAKVFVSAFDIQGHGPSTSLAGNLQLISNIEATPDIKLYDLWIEQELLDHSLSIRLGQEGANDEMMTTKFGAALLNSSFGFPGLPAADLPSGGPNYPMAAPFVRVRYGNDKLSLTGAVFTDDPAPPGSGDPQKRDAGGIAFRLNDHALSFAELAYAGEVGGLSGSYKLGAWYSSARLLPVAFSTVGNEVIQGSTSGFAIYGIVDQLLWKEADKPENGIGAFLQVMGTPTEICFSNLFVEAGLNWKGPFKGREGDTATLGVAYLAIDPAYRKLATDALQTAGSGVSVKSNETVIEATYIYEAAPWWQIQPDLQVVINPLAGVPEPATGVPAKDALVAGVRTTVKF